LLKEQVRYLLRAVDPRLGLSLRALRSQSMAELLALLRSELHPLPPDQLDLDARGGRWENSGSAVAGEQRAELAFPMPTDQASVLMDETDARASAGFMEPTSDCPIQL